MYVALNASVVALAVDHTVYHSVAKNEAAESGLVPPHAYVKHRCVGLGLVRAVDPVEKCLYLVTPVPHSVLNMVNLLIRGTCDLPVTLATQGHGKNALPYITSEMVEGVGTAELRTRHLGRRKFAE